MLDGAEFPGSAASNVPALRRLLRLGGYQIATNALAATIEELKAADATASSTSGVMAEIRDSTAICKPALQ